VPRLYSTEWIAAFNDAVETLDTAAVDVGASLAAAGGSFQVRQVVHDAPGGELRVLLAVAGGRLRLTLDDPATGADTLPANVTLTISYADAKALSRGELDSAEALGRGRVRVRGDLAVLVASQAILRAAADRLAPLQAATTF